MVRRLVLSIVICGACLVAGCARSPQVTFYTLLPGTVHETPSRPANPPTVAVGPVTVPDVVDRPQLVVRESENRLKVLEMHQWGEPLKRDIPRVLAQDLGQLLGSDQVSSYPQNAGTDAQYRVQVDIQRFEAVPGQGVTVEALWQVKRAADRAVERGHSLVREKSEGGGYEPLVAAFSRALSKVGADLAQAISACGQAPAGAGASAAP